MILSWNSITGAYRFCCRGTTFTGVGKSIPNAWKDLGVLAVRSGLARDALGYFQTSLLLNPNQSAVLNQIGIMKLQAGDPSGAREAFSGALAIDPGYQPTRDNLARLDK